VKKNSPKVAIILLNYKSPDNTIECIESILKSKHDEFQIIVVDNNSQDNSVEKIIGYFEGNIIPDTVPAHRERIFPVHSGKLPYIVINEDSIENAGNFSEFIVKNSDSKIIKYPVLLIKNRDNYGFGGGNNSGIKYALKSGNFDFVWLLNNDTVIDKNTLTALIEKVKNNNKIGIAGSLLLYYYQPDTIQTVGGGIFYPILGLSRLYKKGEKLSVVEDLKEDKIKNNINYIMGASLLLKVDMLKDIGLFDDKSFFLFSEELDLFIRAIKKGWDFTVSTSSIVYHKQSASTKNNSEVYYYNLAKSSVVLLKKHYPKLYLIVSLPFITVNSIRASKKTGNWKATINGIKDGLIK